MVKSHCFGCGQYFDEQEYPGLCNFSQEWDTWCHTKCCPGDSDECKVCELYEVKE